MKNLQDKFAGRWLFQDRPIFLMLSLFAMLLINPLVEGRTLARLILSSSLTVIMLSAVIAVLKRRRTVLAIASLGLPWIILHWVSTFVTAGRIWDLLSSAALGLFALFVVAVLVNHLFRASTVTVNTLCRAVSAYVLIGLAWGAAYRTLILLDSGSIGFPTATVGWNDYMYFSFTTLTTLGYGDITPISSFARSLAIIEAVIGPMYLAMLIARLVAMYKAPHGKAP